MTESNAENTAIQRIDPAMAAQSIDIRPMMELALKCPDPAAAIKVFAELQRQQQQDAWRQIWTEKFSRVRAKTKPMTFTNDVPTKDGGVKFRTLPEEKMMEIVEPLIQDEGLEYRYSSRREGPQNTIMVAVMTIYDPTTGYSESAEGSVNTVGAMGGDVGATKTARRIAAINFLSLRVQRDDDANIVGDRVSIDQVSVLKSLLRQARRSETKFLAWALNIEESTIHPDHKSQQNPYGEYWREIRQGRLTELQNELRRAAKKGSATDPAPQGTTSNSNAPISDSKVPQPTTTAPTAGATGNAPAVKPNAAMASNQWVAAQSEASLRSYLQSFAGPTLDSAIKSAKVEGVTAAHPLKNVQRVAYLLRKAEIEFESAKK